MSFLDRFRPSPEGKEAGHVQAFEEKPLFLGIGPTKTGTSWLFLHLSRHPEFAMSPIKELNFFTALESAEKRRLHDRDAQQKLEALRNDSTPADSPVRSDKLACLEERLKMPEEPDRYIGYFRDRASESGIRAFGEISPSYASLSVEGLRRIRESHPRVKLLVTLRDPIDRADAVLRHLWKSGREIPYAEFFGDDLAERLNRLNFRYDLMLDRLFAVFGESEVHVAFFETLFSQPSVDRIADFIGLTRMAANFSEKPGHSPPADTINEEHRDRLAALLAPVYTACRERFGEAALPKQWARF